MSEEHNQTVAMEEATDERPQVVEETSDKDQEQQLLAYLAQTRQKLITFDPPFSDGMLAHLTETRRLLTALVTSVDEGVESITTKSAELTTRADKLRERRPGIKIMNPTDRFDEYRGLLDNIVTEVKKEISTLEEYAGFTEKGRIVVPAGAPDSFEQYALDVSSMFRKQAKKISKDLRVSRSRFSVGFENYERELAHVERYVAMEDIIKAHAEKQKKEKETTESE